MLRDKLHINSNEFRAVMPAQTCLVAGDRIVNKSHIQNYGFLDETLALIGAKFLTTFLPITISNCNDPATNHNLIEIGSFFMSLVKCFTDKNTTTVKITDTTAEIIGKLFLTNKAVIFAANPFDVYELRKEKTVIEHGTFILTTIMNKFFVIDKGSDLGPGLFIIVLRNALAALEKDPQKFNLPLIGDSLIPNINQFLAAIKDSEVNILSRSAAKLSMSM